MSKILTIKEILKLATGYLAQCQVDQPRLEAEVFLANLLGVTRIDLYVNFDRPVVEEELAAMREYFRRRSRGEPLEYIIGVKEFMSLPFFVDNSVLIPRPETEHLVEKALQIMAANNFKEAVDVGTGSGAIAVSLAYYQSDAHVTAIDIAPKALAIAEKNARYHGVEGRLVFLEGDLLEPLVAGEKKFDMVLANPPYIPSGLIDELSPEVKKQPHLALDGGPYGLSFYKPLIEDAALILAGGGYLGMEVGWGQAAAVASILKENGFVDVETINDYSGIGRCVWGKKQ